MRCENFCRISHHTPLLFLYTSGFTFAVTLLAISILRKLGFIKVEKNGKKRQVRPKVPPKIPNPKYLRRTSSKQELMQKIESGVLGFFFQNNLKSCQKDFQERIQVEDIKDVYHEYLNVHCAAETVITVDLETGPKKIHANLLDFCDRKYISAQCPATFESIDKNKCELFWVMSFDNTQLVCDLAGPKKIPKYYPTSEVRDIKYNDVKVSFLREQQVSSNPEIIMVAYDVSYKGETRTIHRLQFTDWPRGEGFIKPEVLKSLCKQIKAYKGRLPPLFHCRSGMGWSATLLAAYELMIQIEEDSTGWEDPQDKIDNLIYALRMQRDPQFIQTEAHYVSLFLLVHNLLK